MERADTGRRALASTTGPGWMSADDVPDGQEDDGTSVLVARRHRCTGEISYFRCWAPGDVTLARLVEAICRRWRIEETFQLGKAFTGLDQGQVTCWYSWMRWSLFTLIASAVLALTTAATTTASPADPTRLVPLACPEPVLILRAFVFTPPVRDTRHILSWMAWRRHHQAIARACHQRRHALQDRP